MTKLWATMADDRTWLVNPRRKRRRRAKGKRRRRNPGLMPNRGHARRRRRKGRVPPGLARYMAAKRGSKHMAKRRRSRRRSGGRRHFRRNPGRAFSRGAVAQLTRGVKDAFAIVVGKAAARALPSFIGLPQTGAVALLTQAAVAVGVGMVATRFAGGDVGRFVTAGALAAPLEGIVAGLGIPVLSPALASYPLGMIPGAPGIGPVDYSSMSAYPEAMAVDGSY